MSTFDIFSYSSLTIISHFHIHYVKYIVGRATLNNPMINKMNSVYEYHLKLYSARNAWGRSDPFSTQQDVLILRFTHDNMASHCCVA